MGIDQCYEEYGVGWICNSRHVKFSKELFDEGPRSIPSTDSKYEYFGGQMSGIGVVIAAACDDDGSSIMAQMATDMLQKFPKIRFRLLVGIGGACPILSPLMNAEDDIRLGDVVVGYIKGAGRLVSLAGGAMHYTDENSKFNITSYLKPPPRVVLNAVQQRCSDYAGGPQELDGYIHKLTGKFDSHYPGKEHDQLYKSNIIHVEGCDTCTDCKKKLEQRKDRALSYPVLHYGLIASGNPDMKEAERAERRNTIRHEEDICCLDEEAVGLTDECPSLMIRGICDYADSHRNKKSNKKWQAYAATTATAYARYLLGAIKATDVTSLAPYQPPSPKTEAPKTEVPVTPPEKPSIPPPPQNDAKGEPPSYNKIYPAQNPGQGSLHQRCLIGLLRAEDVDRQLAGPQDQNFRNDLRGLIRVMIQGFGDDFATRSERYRNFTTHYNLRSDGNITVGEYETLFDGMSIVQSAAIGDSMQAPDVLRLRAARAHTFLTMSYGRAPVVFVIYDTLVRLWEYVEVKTVDRKF